MNNLVIILEVLNGQKNNDPANTCSYQWDGWSCYLVRPALLSLRALDMLCSGSNSSLPLALDCDPPAVNCR